MRWHRAPKLLTQAGRFWLSEAADYSLSHSLHSRGSSINLLIFTALQSVKTKTLTFPSLFHLKDDIIALYMWFKWNNWLFNHFLWAASQPGWPIAELDTPNACRFFVVLRPLSHLSKQRDLNIWLKSQFWLKDKCELLKNAVLDPGTALWEPFQYTGNYFGFLILSAISFDFFFHLSEKDLRSRWITIILLVK